MNISDLQNICTKLPGTTQDIKWDDHLCFNIGGKMFLITSPDTVPVSASFKTDEEEFEALIAMEGLKPAAYLARYKWVHIDDIDRLSRKEWEKIINNAYRLVGSKLPKSLRKKIKFEF